MARATALEIRRPKHQFSQEYLLDWVAKAHAAAEQNPDLYSSIRERLFKLGSKVESRGIVIDDCCHENWADMELYPHSCMGKKAKAYDRIVTDTLFDWFPESYALPSHVIHVTCTGYTAPSPVQQLVSQRSPQTVVTHAYHMGCYAAIPAMRMAAEGALIIHSELSSLHMNPGTHSLDQLVIQTLFADGFARYLITEDEVPGYEILALQEEVYPGTLSAMTWNPASWGMEMSISREVPTHIAKALPSFMKRLEEKAGRSLQKAFFAIHPGGPKIVEKIAELLNLHPSQYAHSMQILKTFGNMSSATLPHVWEAMWKEIPDGSLIVSLAFGPGLTLCGAVFQCVY
ncbi:MAG: hypothetical protein JSR58_03460 [Verrucomicrobia bacterium]|nr:hypothetical protein [Verrucomicrobiota bacterium]